MPSLTPLKRSPLSIHRLHVRLFSQPVDSPPSSLTLFEISHSNHPKNPNLTYFLKWVSGITFVGSGLGYLYYSDSAFDSLKNSFSSFAEWSKATKESMTGKNPKFLFGGIFVIIWLKLGFDSLCFDDIEANYKLYCSRNWWVSIVPNIWNNIQYWRDVSHLLS